MQWLNCKIFHLGLAVLFFSQVKETVCCPKPALSLRSICDERVENRVIVAKLIPKTELTQYMTWKFDKTKDTDT